MVAARPSGALVRAPEEPVKWLADENFRNAIIRGILRKRPSFDVVRTQDLSQTTGKDDNALLRFATAEDRIVVTHDLSTMVPAMREQLRTASQCAPIVMVPDSLPIGQVIDEILFLDDCALHADWSAGVLYLPLR